MISLARDTSSPRMGRNTVFLFRLAIAIVVFADGLLRRIIARADAARPYEKLAGAIGMAPETVSVILGGLEILVALILASGRASRWCVSFVTVGMVLFLWHETSGVFPFFMEVIYRAPLAALLAMVWVYGPGTHVFRGRSVRRQSWTRG